MDALILARMQFAANITFHIPILIAMATPWISATVRERGFSLPEIIALMAIPLTFRGKTGELKYA